MGGEIMRVLHVLTGLSNGGAETYILNMYRNINREKIQFDFLLRSRNNNESLLNEISSLGGRVYYTSEFPKHILKNYKEMNSFFKCHPEYKIIHVHANSLVYITPLIVAKKYKIQCRIIHSHNTRTANDMLYKPIHMFNKKIIKYIATTYLACSEVAGKWMFNDSNFQIMKNAINVDKYSFNYEVREKIRNYYKLDGKLVLGNVGRFVYQKNHEFLIDIFNCVHARNKNAMLMLIGEGKLKSEIIEKVKYLGLSEKVMFIGAVSNVQDYLQAMDIMVFPSHYEGLPITLIEAQAAGLKCFISDNISDEICLTPLIKKIELKHNVEEWADEILNESVDYSRNLMSYDLRDSGYDIKNEVVELEKIYEQKYEG